jgi:hypothetical protein
MYSECAILYFVACPTLLYFSTSYKKWYYFLKKKVIEYKMYVSIFPTALYELFFSLRTERDMIQNVYWSSCKVTVFS